MIKDIENKFSNIINKIFSEEDFPKKIAVAVSGGIDSMALTFLLQKICENKNIQLFCLTVDHRLRENSAFEAEFVGEILSKNSINHLILESYLTKNPQVNIESQARQVRYNLLVDFCSKNEIKHLFIAHHEQDLAENFLIRLFRGSGIDGLAAMDYVTYYQEINLVRSLLDFTKEELKEYLLLKKIDWIEDESNNDQRILRNKIRKFLSCLPESNLINQRISLASKSILQSRKIIEDDMIEMADQILEFDNLGYFLLFTDNFNSLPEEKAMRYLAWILMEVSGQFYKPRKEKLDSLYKWIVKDENHKARSFYGCVIEKYQDNQLIIYRERRAIKIEINENGLFDNRFSIQIPKNKNNIIDLMNSEEFNDFAEGKKDLKKIKNPLKKIFYTIPILKKEDKIISLPEMKFNFKTPLRKITL